MPDRYDVTVTLVHGTNASKATWIHKHSLLWVDLQTVLPTPVFWDPFIWSGGNSPDARYEAAKNLAVRLLKTVETYSSATHFVVGHSHGGNIALQALQIAKLNDKVHIACLSTPFTHIEPRIVKPSTIKNIALSAVIDLSVFTTLASPWRHAAHATLIHYSFVVMLSAGALLIYHWVKIAVPRIAETMSLRNPICISLCIIRMIGDEAIAAIGTAHLLSWVFTQMLNKLDNHVESFPVRGRFKIRALREIHWKRIAFFILLAFALLYGAEISAQMPKLSSVLSWAAFASLFLPIFGSLLLASLSMLESMIQQLEIPFVLITISLLAPLAMVISLCTLPFGGKSILLGWLYQITSEATPVGTWTVHQVVPEKPVYMNHSATYSDPNALRILRNWMRSMLQNDSKKEC